VFHPIPQIQTPLSAIKFLYLFHSRLTIQRTKISHNRQGFYTLHYNRYLGDDSQVTLKGERKRKKEGKTEREKERGKDR
jgi:hypothetical protein